MSRAFPIWQPPQNIKKLAKQLHLPDDVEMVRGLFCPKEGVAFPTVEGEGVCWYTRLPSALHVLKDAGDVVKCDAGKFIILIRKFLVGTCCSRATLKFPLMHSKK